ncbi:MAG: 2-C-methyl-D-erythritol 2,4-cyclodiphosphate synthase [Aquificota bacterium]|nr:2-C-methyl-D-erythritol 2,4-cyclodiphosphate synthase [Aquificota bacterium]
MEVRVGLGFDSHEFDEDKPLVLGGIRFEGHRGLKGHSDGDVILHAITDALLGAVGEGDIGELFSDDDSRWKGADSRVFLGEALKRVREKGFEVVNVDCVVVADSPRISPAKRAIRERIASLMGIPPDRVSVKGKRKEGFSGEDGISCICTVLLMR